MKRCKTCGIEKPRTAFAADRARPDGLFRRCRSCHHDYYAVNRERILRRQAEYVAQNRETIKERCRRYYAENREQRRAADKARNSTEARRTSHRRSRLKHLERIRARDRERMKQPAARAKERERSRRRYATNPHKRERAHAYYARHRDTFLRRAAEYKIKHPDQIRRWRHQRSARLRGATQTVTAREWAEILDYFAGRCAYCLAPATTQDHIEALINGGTHTADNVVPACRSCNSRKQDSSLIVALSRGVGVVALEQETA